MAVQWLRLCAPNARDVGFLLGWRTKTLHTAKKKKKKMGETEVQDMT